jgi:low affinity Fe/Cu permease
LDELIRANSSARNRLLTLEDLTEQELEQMKKSFARVAARGGVGEGVPSKVEADLDQAEDGIERAKGKISRAKTEA